jgi:CRP-like cAMP-binding protein
VSNPEKGAGMATATPRTRILILGGGFGGVYTARALEKLLRRDPGVEIGLVSREDYLVFQPMLPEVISGSIGLVDTISPIRRLCPRTTLYTREIEGIDLKKKRVMVAAGFGSDQGDLECDHLVMALGNVTSFRGAPGLAEHALPFKYLGDALAIRNHVIHALDIVQLKTGRTLGVGRAHFEADEVIVREGDRADRLYVVVDGEVEVVRGGAAAPLAVLGRGDSFGEIALVKGSPRTATVRSRTPVNVLTVERETFHGLFAHVPQLRRIFERLVEERLGPGL